MKRLGRRKQSHVKENLPVSFLNHPQWLLLGTEKATIFSQED
jgi:hypothetical protein